MWPVWSRRPEGCISLPKGLTREPWRLPSRRSRVSGATRVACGLVPLPRIPSDSWLTHWSIVVTEPQHSVCNEPALLKAGTLVQARTKGGRPGSTPSPVSLARLHRRKRVVFDIASPVRLLGDRARDARQSSHGHRNLTTKGLQRISPRVAEASGGGGPSPAQANGKR